MEEVTQLLQWQDMATCAGAVTAVTLITQFTKECGFIKRIPTQLWSYLIALIVLYPAYYFSGQLSLPIAFLVPFNAVIVALAANGGFEAVKKVIAK